MASNLAAHGVQAHSEQVLAQLSARIGKHQAQALLAEVFSADSVAEADLVAALVASGVADNEARGWLLGNHTGSAGAMIDRVAGDGS